MQTSQNCIEFIVRTVERDVSRDCWCEDVLKQLFACSSSQYFSSFNDRLQLILIAVGKYSDRDFWDSVVAITQAWQSQRPLPMSVSLRSTHLSQRSIAFTNAVLYQCCPCISPRTYRRKRKNCWSCYIPEGECGHDWADICNCLFLGVAHCPGMHPLQAVLVEAIWCAPGDNTGKGTCAGAGGINSFFVWWLALVLCCSGTCCTVD